MTTEDDKYIKIWSLLKSIYYCDNAINESTNSKFQKVLEKWNLGDSEQELNDGVDDRIDFDLELVLSDISKFAKDLKNQLEPEVLTILFGDIKEVVFSDEKVTETESKIIRSIQNEWSDKLVDFSEIREMFKPDKIYQPSNNLLALGYLFLITMKVDGHVDKREIDALRRNLKVWSNDNARMIIAAVNMAENAITSKNILDFFSESEELSDNVKMSIANCAEFLKKNAYVGLRRIMYEQIVKIIKADNKIHKNELLIRETLRRVWNDLGV